MVRIVALAAVLCVAAPAAGQQETTVYLTLDQAPHAVFPGAEIERRDIASTPELRTSIKTKLGRLVPSVWEPSYVAFAAKQNGQTIGYAVIVDEIGKHRPFTLIVAATPDFRVKDVAVMVYRETRGGEITQRRFLGQYKGKRAADPIQLDRDIIGVSGATLSVQGANRAVHKALAVLQLVYGS
jgi:Na+-translocating ferredoxin:NAD+ oxidoreductase RnfG subunit